ncbi:hypothetical protein Cadr_000003699 [Camelus dromedarius]|uniref:Uncharacterized protein n=1 Tax=Camelus dromedarius TaxID=9838 RepID=A0A5N4C1L0_CAMDR|nr:hypothetical protein Cadr_000003699 [Camelus dromedarius]
MKSVLLLGTLPPPYEEGRASLPKRWGSISSQRQAADTRPLTAGAAVTLVETQTAPMRLHQGTRGRWTLGLVLSLDWNEEGRVWAQPGPSQTVQAPRGGVLAFEIALTPGQWGQDRVKQLHWTVIRLSTEVLQDIQEGLFRGWGPGLGAGDCIRSQVGCRGGRSGEISGPTATLQDSLWDLGPSLCPQLLIRRPGQVALPTTKTVPRVVQRQGWRTGFPVIGVRCKCAQCCSEGQHEEFARPPPVTHHPQPAFLPLGSPPAPSLGTGPSPWSHERGSPSPAVLAWLVVGPEPEAGHTQLLMDARRGLQSSDRPYVAGQLGPGSKKPRSPSPEAQRAKTRRPGHYWAQTAVSLLRYWASLAVWVMEPRTMLCCVPLTAGPGSCPPPCVEVGVTQPAPSPGDRAGDPRSQADPGPQVAAGESGLMWGTCVGPVTREQGRGRTEEAVGCHSQGPGYDLVAWRKGRCWMAGDAFSPPLPLICIPSGWVLNPPWNDGVWGGRRSERPQRPNGSDPHVQARAEGPCHLSSRMSTSSPGGTVARPGLAHYVSPRPRWERNAPGTDFPALPPSCSLLNTLGRDRCIHTGTPAFPSDSHKACLHLFQNLKNRSLTKSAQLRMTRSPDTRDPLTPHLTPASCVWVLVPPPSPDPEDSTRTQGTFLVPLHCPSSLEQNTSQELGNYPPWPQATAACWPVRIVLPAEEEGPSPSRKRKDPSSWEKPDPSCPEHSASTSQQAPQAGPYSHSATGFPEGALRDGDPLPTALCPRGCPLGLSPTVTHLERIPAPAVLRAASDITGVVVTHDQVLPGEVVTEVGGPHPGAWCHCPVAAVSRSAGTACWPAGRLGDVRNCTTSAPHHSSPGPGSWTRTWAGLLQVGTLATFMQSLQRHGPTLHRVQEERKALAENSEAAEKYPKNLPCTSMGHGPPKDAHPSPKPHLAGAQAAAATADGKPIVRPGQPGGAARVPRAEQAGVGQALTCQGPVVSCRALSGGRKKRGLQVTKEQQWLLTSGAWMPAWGCQQHLEEEAEEGTVNPVGRAVLPRAWGPDTGPGPCSHELALCTCHLPMCSPAGAGGAGSQLPGHVLSHLGLGDSSGQPRPGPQSTWASDVLIWMDRLARPLCSGPACKPRGDHGGHSHSGPLWPL